MVDAWARRVEAQLDGEAFQRDPDFLGALLPWMERMGRYFDAEVRGLEKVPAGGPVLVVGNHSGGALTPDTPAFMAAWYRHFGLDRPLVGLAFDAVYAVPGFSTLMRKIGQVPASSGNAGRALDEGASVLVYPGGAHEVYRPWRDRDRIDFGDHKGFVRLALERAVPVVPVVGHGGHHTLVVLTRGEALARRIRLERIRLRAFPILLQVPWGVSVPALPGLPLPAKITVEVEEPLDWSHHGPGAARDESVVQACYDEITGRMQARLDALAAEHPHPIRERVGSALRPRPRRDRR